MEVTSSYETSLYIGKIIHDKDNLEPEILCRSRIKDMKTGISIDEIIGGSLRLKNCRCGYPFCAGDIIRRFYKRQLRKEDYFLLFVQKQVIFVFMGRLTELNLLYLNDIKAGVVSPLCPCPDAKRVEYVLNVYGGGRDTTDADKTATDEEKNGAEETEKQINVLYHQGNQYGKNVPVIQTIVI